MARQWYRPVRKAEEPKEPKENMDEEGSAASALQSMADMGGGRAAEGSNMRKWQKMTEAEDEEDSAAAAVPPPKVPEPTMSWKRSTAKELEKILAARPKPKMMAAKPAKVEDIGSEAEAEAHSSQKAEDIGSEAEDDGSQANDDEAARPKMMAARPKPPGAKARAISLPTRRKNVIQPAKRERESSPAPESSSEELVPWRRRPREGRGRGDRPAEKKGRKGQDNRKGDKGH